MKFGLRRRSYKKSFKARTTAKLKRKAKKPSSLFMVNAERVYGRTPKEPSITVFIGALRSACLMYLSSPLTVSGKAMPNNLKIKEDCRAMLLQQIQG